MIATCIILGYDDFKDWNTLKACLGNATEVLTRCRTFDSASLTEDQIDRLHAIMAKADFTVDSIRNKSLPASLFAEWAIDVYNHAMGNVRVETASPPKRSYTAPAPKEEVYTGPVSVEVLQNAAPPERVQPQRITQFANRKIQGDLNSNASGYKHRNVEMAQQTADI